MDRSYAQGTGEPHRNFSESADQERNSTASYHPVNPAAPLLRQSSAARIVPKPLTRVDSRPLFSPVSETPPRQFESQRTSEYYPDTARYSNNKPPESIQRQSDSVQRQPDSVQRPLKVVPERTYDRPEQSPGYSYSQYTKPPTNNTYQSKPDLVNKPLENNVERQNAVQRPYQPADITRDNRTEVPLRNVDPPSRNFDVPSRNLEVPPRNLDVPSRNFDVPSKNLEVPSRNLDIRTLEVPSRTLDVHTRNVTRLNGNNLESRPYENSKTSSENRPVNRELIENRTNYVTENRQPFDNHITTENRPISRDLPENRLGNALENRLPVLENRIVPQEAVINRPTPDIQPRRIEVPGDRPRPEPPPILRQPSNPNLQPAPFRAPGGGVRSFRQFVNTQLIPARSPDFQRPLNPPISQDGMGLNASREDHTRLIKLARNEMESPRPESVTGDRPVRVEQPQPQRKPEPPFVEMQRPLTNTEQPDSLNSLKSNIMPSGKPVAKEMTITVSGKLPPQAQPTRPTKPENRPPIQVKKTLDGSEPLRHIDSNLDLHRPPFNESGNHFNDSSSGNLTNYRRAEEYTENGRRNPEPSFYINDPAERFSKPPELLKRPERSMNFESNERNLTSMVYTPPPENNGNQVTSRPGSGEHESNSKQRPSDLNLSGMVSEKKGRVGWKGEEKKNNPVTPADSKGVSFVETPRKKTSDGKSPAGTWCAQTGRFIPSPFERPKSPDPRPKTPTTPKKKRFSGTYCAKTGRYIPPEGSVQTSRDDRKTPDLKLPGSGRSTPDVRVRSAAATPRDESPHVSFIEERCFTPRTPKKPLIAFGSVVPQDIVEKRRQKVRRTRSNDWVERRRYTGDDGVFKTFEDIF
ncbi:hypothetical protein B566_EDAN016254 [Ephemera danica]|nr:hypothetical protein B566_EDAN016254 [Ephemera danica]